jgi:transcriptional regulator with XRE-family HTH domain
MADLSASPELPQVSPTEPLSTIVRRLRREAGLTLSELGKRSDISSSALSKIENGQMSPTYDTMQRLADGLGIDITDLFAGQRRQSTGRLTVTRHGQGVRQSIAQYDYEMLCADVRRKQFVPMLATIKANDLKDFPNLVSHEGEEFIFVLDGRITLNTEHYSPMVLEAGDSCYFDSTMGHAVVSTGDAAATILWVCSRIVAPLSE